MQAASISEMLSGSSKPMIPADLARRSECSVSLKMTPP